MKKFVEIQNYGNLFIDKVLFESNFPIIFTCVNQDKDIFLCVCCQSNTNGCKWLLGKTDAHSIVLMLKDQLSVRELLLRSEDKITVDYINQKYTVYHNNSDWNEDSIYLPKQESYLEAEDGEFDEEIIYYLQYNTINYKETTYERFSVTTGIICETEQISDEVLELDIVPKRLVITTLEVSGKLNTNTVSNKIEYISYKKPKTVYKDNYDICEKNIEMKFENDINILFNAA